MWESEAGVRPVLKTAAVSERSAASSVATGRAFFLHFEEGWKATERKAV